MAIPNDYVERCYAGWLGKIAGVRLGAPIEGWTYEKIRRVLGENVWDYIVDYDEFAADDDTNGPLFFQRALEDYACSEELTAAQIGRTWLNYTPYEHGFYWWGGYGVSTEHTAYLNLRAGIEAPRSGSIEQNGRTVAEQIGGQIFIDCWGLCNPGDPQRAARFARKAASVSHDGEGIYGGQFVAACVAAAFTAHDVREVIEAGLSVIPEDCGYRRMARDVIAFWERCPDDWRACFDFVHDHYGYDKYAGACHIIPNSAVMILSMLYGGGDFGRTICICNMCGWDTDCTAGNVGAIMGVLVGIQGIDYDKWLRPIHDFLACSSVVGCLNIVDVPSAALYTARLGYRLAGEAYPQQWETLLRGEGPRFSFALPGSTHAFRLDGVRAGCLRNAGGRLRVWAQPEPGREDVEVYHRTYYRPADFTDSRYDPAFSPILYPGQRVRARVTLDGEAQGAYTACAYVLDGNGGGRVCGERVRLEKGETRELTLDIPPMVGACLERAGVLFERVEGGELLAFVEEMDFTGGPDYTLDFAREREEVWHFMHREISQMTRLCGIWALEDGALVGSSEQMAEAYTGDIAWGDVEVSCTLRPGVGGAHQFMARVQGAQRCYAVRLCEGGRVALMKHDEGIYRELASAAYAWRAGETHELTLRARGANLTVLDGAGRELLACTDSAPYRTGAVGVGVEQGRCVFERLRVRAL